VKLATTPWDIIRLTTLANGLGDPHLTLNGEYDIDADGYRWDVARGSSGYSDYQIDRRLDACFRDTSYTYAQSINYAAQLGSYAPGLNNSPWIKIPSKFTGTMRKVVQMLVGMGRPIHYEFSVYRSHGIWHAGDGTPWVIEIGTRGILAARLPLGISDSTTLSNFKTKQAVSGYDLAYVPGAGNPIPEDPNALARAITTGSVLRLANASVLNSFYNLTPYYEACGWAFSYSGHEAQNTAWSWHGDGNPETDFIDGYRFKVTFGESGGRPVLTSFSQVEKGYLHGDRITHFKFPGDTLAQGHYSFDIYHGNTSKPACETTFYVYYDGDQEQLCRYWSGETGSNSTLSEYSAGTHNTPFTFGTVFSAGGSIQLRNGTLNSGGSAPQVYVNERTNSSYTSFTGTEKSATLTDLGMPGYAAIDYPRAILTPSCYVKTERRSTNANYTHAPYFTATVPFHDRESIYIYRQEYRMLNASQTWSISVAASAGGNGRQNEVNRSDFPKIYANPPANITAGSWFSADSLGSPGFRWPSGIYPLEIPLPDGKDASDIIDNSSYSSSSSSSSGPGVESASDTITLVCSLLGEMAIGEHVLDGSTACTDWLKYIGNLTSGCFTDYQYYHVIADAFSGGRIASKQSGGVSASGYAVGGVDANYAEAYNGVNFVRFFCGVP
jgi:hypothetical protein